MVMTLGMSPEIGQRLLGGQQGGGPFMGRTSATSPAFFEMLPGGLFCFKKEARSPTWRIIPGIVSS